MQEAMRPLAKAATMLPPTAFRFDPGAAITVLARYLPQIVTGGADGLKLLGSFKKARTACCARIMPSRTGPTSACADRQTYMVMPTCPCCTMCSEHPCLCNCCGLQMQVLDDDGGITDPFIRNYLDLLCFLLSGLPADGTIAAEVAFMFNVCFFL
jgi:hypothetical protein